MPARDGLTLLEIVLATAIFAVGVAVLGSQLELARQSGLRSTRQADAMNRAASLIGEAVALTTATDVPADIAEDAGGGWNETLTVTPYSTTTLLLTARVTHTDARDNRDADVTLERIVFAPSLLEAVDSGGLL